MQYIYAPHFLDTTRPHSGAAYIVSAVRKETGHTQTHDTNNTTQHITRTTPRTTTRRTTPLT